LTVEFLPATVSYLRTFRGTHFLPIPPLNPLQTQLTMTLSPCTQTECSQRIFLQVFENNSLLARWYHRCALDFNVEKNQPTSAPKCTKASNHTKTSNQQVSSKQRAPFTSGRKDCVGRVHQSVVVNSALHCRGLVRVIPERQLLQGGRPDNSGDGLIERPPER